MQAFFSRWILVSDSTSVEQFEFVLLFVLLFFVF
jgi:hypothetical protein